MKVDSLYWPAWIGLGASYSLNGMVPKADTILNRLFAADSAMGFQMLDIIGNEQKRLNARRKQAEDSLHQGH